jgi:hypothetical protein
LKGKKSIKKDLIFSKINKKNKDYNLNKNKMKGHISIFLWPMHIPRPCKRERKKKKLGHHQTTENHNTCTTLLEASPYHFPCASACSSNDYTTLHTQIKLTCINKKNIWKV